MSVMYVNFFSNDSGTEFQGGVWPACEEFHRSQRAATHIRVEMRWNGYPVRPPVVIRAQDCSHYWRLSRYDSDLMVLERRK